MSDLTDLFNGQLPLVPEIEELPAGLGSTSSPTIKHGITDKSQIVLSVNDLRVIEGERCFLDRRVALRLGYERPTFIRRLIDRNKEDFEKRFGPIRHRDASVDFPQGGSHQVTEYWLTKGQVLWVCRKSDARNADDVMEEVIRVFLAVDAGTLIPDTPVTHALLAPERSIIDIVDAKINEFETRQYTWWQSFTQRLGDLFSKIIEHNDFMEAWCARQRVDVSKEDEAIVIAVLQMFFGGKCPCCQRRQLLDERGQPIKKRNGHRVMVLDHMRQSSAAGLFFIWPVCSGESDDKESCNYRLTYGRKSSMFRVDIEPHFMTWVRRVEEFLEYTDKQAKLPL